MEEGTHSWLASWGHVLQCGGESHAPIRLNLVRWLCPVFNVITVHRGRVRGPNTLFCCWLLASTTCCVTSVYVNIPRATTVIKWEIALTATVIVDFQVFNPSINSFSSSPVARQGASHDETSRREIQFLLDGRQRCQGVKAWSWWKLTTTLE